MKTLKDILILEDKGDFELAFEFYNELYQSDKANFEVWKHFYFYLWLAPEETSEEFQSQINLQQSLRDLYNEGKQLFQNETEFKFITGYTISILPYVFGDYAEFEKIGNELLRQAHKEKPNDKIYKMVYLGTINSNIEEYKKAELEASQVVFNRFQGPGLLNNCFRHVLNRVKKTK